MARGKRKRSQVKFASTPGAPMLFCTPSQATALLSEGRKPILLIRHGITDWNREMRLQGREDIPLCDEGRQQAADCAAFLRLGFSKNEGSSIGIYSSPLSRAMDTAVCIASSLALPPPKIEAGLIEREYGALAGLTPQKRKNLYPTLADYPPDVESVPSAAKRMKQTLSTLREQEESILIAVTHGGVMNALFSYITGKRAGLGCNFTKNCTVAMVAVGRYDVIPLAFNLTAQVFPEYIQNIHFPKKN